MKQRLPVFLLMSVVCSPITMYVITQLTPFIGSTSSIFSVSISPKPVKNIHQKNINVANLTLPIDTFTLKCDVNALQIKISTLQTVTCLKWSPSSFESSLQEDNIMWYWRLDIIWIGISKQNIVIAMNTKYWICFD